MPIEHEHRYLLKPNSVANIFDGKDYTLEGVYNVEQFYIANDPTRKMCERIRSKSMVGSNFSTQYTRTTKIGSAPKSNEHEDEISEASFLQLREYFTIGRVIKKFRYVIFVDGLCWEIDAMDIDDETFMFAELENPPSEYKLPFGNTFNITGIHQYSNVSIALNSEMPLNWGAVKYAGKLLLSKGDTINTESVDKEAEAVN